MDEAILRPLRPMSSIMRMLFLTQALPLSVSTVLVLSLSSCAPLARDEKHRAYDQQHRDILSPFGGSMSVTTDTVTFSSNVIPRLDTLPESCGGSSRNGARLTSDGRHPGMSQQRRVYALPTMSSSRASSRKPEINSDST
ncbi:hypothetical protein B0H15DRAFT_157747 [Mycena belliarum]|uniref:Uncharacterized protein n=1 Tax=Mycena belliarum TaxID=1033014 RepID=A0AAD6XPF5_9AGAR|nr:hypothetical protein B0H15DRAFT_157747 [Mycena belliae]